MVAVDDSHPWWRARLNFIGGVLYSLDASKTRILDFGCGSGGALSHCQKLGFAHLTGMEVSEICISVARSRGLHVKKITQEIPLIPSGSFEVILLLDVLEHLEDDLAYLKVFENALTPGGLILISVPANRFLWSFHDVANSHFRRYSKKLFKKTLASTDLTIVSIRWWNSLLFMYVFMSRKIPQFRIRNQLESEIKMPPKFLVPLIYKLLATEARFAIYGRIPGVSLVAILRK
jgi:SAM-dependent methyltransferase